MNSKSRYVVALFVVTFSKFAVNPQAMLSIISINKCHIIFVCKVAINALK